MAKGPWIRTSLLGLVLGVNFSCGCSPSSPSPPVDLNGTWSGTLGQAASGTSVRLVWSASQLDVAVSGPVAVSKPADDLSLAGTMSGTVHGQSLSLTYTVPAGSVPGFASCQISGTGAAGAASTTITGSLNLTATSCEGFTGHPTGTQNLLLTRP